jgi:DNA polymerase-3 subunit delta
MPRPAFSVCLCPDSRLLQLRLQALLKAHPPAKDKEWLQTVFWGDEGLSASFWENLTLQSLFAQPRALVLRKTEALPAILLEKQLSPALIACLGRNGEAANPLIWPLVCIESAFDKEKAKIPAHIQRLPFYTKAEALGLIDINPPLTGKKISDYINAETRRLGIKLTSRELFTLAGALPPDAALIDGELEKLSLCRDAEGKLPEEALSLIGNAHELGIFEMLRILQQQGNSLDAWKRILKDRLAGDNMIFGFLAILQREARLLWQCLKGPAPALSEFALRQKKQAAAKLGTEGTAALWDIAIQAEKGIKSGARSPDQALDMLAADLFALFGGFGRT